MKKRPSGLNYATSEKCRQRRAQVSYLFQTTTITRKDLAQFFNVSISVIGNDLRGIRKNPAPTPFFPHLLTSLRETEGPKLHPCRLPMKSDSDLCIQSRCQFAHRRACAAFERAIERWPELNSRPIGGGPVIQSFGHASGGTRKKSS